MECVCFFNPKVSGKVDAAIRGRNPKGKC